MRDPRPQTGARAARILDIRLRELDRKLSASGPRGGGGPAGSPGPDGAVGADGPPGTAGPPGKFNLFTSGRWYVPVGRRHSATPIGWSYGTGSAGRGHITVTPFYSSNPVTLDAAGVNVKLANSGSLIRLGCYADTGHGSPGALTGDWGQLNCPALGTPLMPITHTLTEGLHWLAAVDQVTHTSGRAYIEIIGEALTSVGQLDPANLLTDPIMLYGQAGYVTDTQVALTGPLPDPFPAAFQSDRYAARIALHVA